VDPTNGCVPDERYIVLGWGRDFADVTPLKGVMTGGGEHKLTVAVDVLPVDDAGSARLLF
jgi:transglutaminase-like putative cysteine protease